MEITNHTVTTHPTHHKNFWSIFNFACGNIGGSALSMTFSTYFMVYVTTAMFTGVPQRTSQPVYCYYYRISFCYPNCRSFH